MRNVLLACALSAAVIAEADPWLVTDYVVVTGTETYPGLLVESLTTVPPFVTTSPSTVPAFEGDTRSPTTIDYVYTVRTITTIISTDGPYTQPLYSEVIPTVSPIPATRTETAPRYDSNTYLYIEVPTGIGKPLITSKPSDTLSTFYRMIVTYTWCLNNRSDDVVFSPPPPIAAQLTPTSIFIRGTEVYQYIAPTAISTRDYYNVIGQNAIGLSSNHCPKYVPVRSPSPKWPNTTCNWDDPPRTSYLASPDFRCGEIDPCCYYCDYYVHFEDTYILTYYNCSSGYSYLVENRTRHNSAAAVTTTSAFWPGFLAAVSCCLLLALI